MFYLNILLYFLFCCVNKIIDVRNLLTHSWPVLHYIDQWLGQLFFKVQVHLKILKNYWEKVCLSIVCKFSFNLFVPCFIVISVMELLTNGSLYK